MIFPSQTHPVHNNDSIVAITPESEINGGIKKKNNNNNCCLLYGEVTAATTPL